MVAILVILTFSLFIGVDLLLIYRRKRREVRETELGACSALISPELIPLMQDGGEPIENVNEKEKKNSGNGKDKPKKEENEKK